MEIATLNEIPYTNAPWPGRKMHWVTVALALGVTVGPVLHA